MSKRRVRKILKKIQNISEARSGGENSESENVQIESVYFSDTNDEEENILNVRRGQKRRRILSDSESESSQNVQNTEVALDGTVWEQIKAGPAIGRLPYNFKEISGPTGNAKRNVLFGKTKTAFFLIIDKWIVEHIKTCTEAEALRELGTAWDLPIPKLYAFIAILYARGAYQARNLPISYLWNSKWEPAFFSKTMSRNTFTEILKFLRFDKKTQRSKRLKTDKFALISDVWNKFIENSQNNYKADMNVTIDEQLFPTKVRCKFTQYMPNKPDKFGIKFWLASDVNSKYIINGFPYLGNKKPGCHQYHSVNLLPSN